MAMQMRAAVYLGPEKIEISELPVPEPVSGELLVKVRAATTCGTDVKTYRRGHPKVPPPFTFGHEFAGDIVKVGKNVDRFREGMRVTANVFADVLTVSAASLSFFTLERFFRRWKSRFSGEPR